MSSPAEEDTYSVIFTSLKHPIRRRILRILSNEPQSFSDLLKQFKIESSHLTYHIDGLGSLLYKTRDGRYALSSLGEAAVSTMMKVEDPPTPLHSTFKPYGRRRWIRPLTFILVCALIASLIFSVVLYANYLKLNSMNSELSKLNSAETVILDPLTWQTEKPSSSFIGYLPHYQPMTHYYVDDGSINATVQMGDYYLGSFWFLLNVTVDLEQGYVYNINVTTQTSKPSSRLIAALNDGNAHPNVEGLTVLTSNASSFFGANGVNNTRRAQMTMASNWLTTTPDNQTEEAIERIDVTYFNGSNYKKVIFPFHFISIGCTNTNLENAEEIAVGSTIANRSLALTRRDEFFKVHLIKGETVNMTLIPPAVGDFWLYVYNSSAFWLYTLNSSNVLSPNYSSTVRAEPQKLTFTSNVTDWWFIDVRRAAGGDGFYILNVVDLP
jgi:DNA-binding transcriptional ArsR family regulator